MMLPIVVSLVKNIAKLDPIFQEPKQMETPANIYISKHFFRYNIYKLFAITDKLIPILYQKLLELFKNLCKKGINS